MSLIISTICATSTHSIEEQISEKPIFLNNFLKFNQEKIKQLLRKLSIIEHAVLLASLHEHGFTKEFGCDYFNYSRQLLKNKIYDSLNQAANQDVSCWHNEIGWFKEINRWPLKTQNIIEDVLRRIIRPVAFSLAETKTVLEYKDNKGKTIGLKDKYGNVLIEGNNIEWISLNSTGTRVTVQYKNGRGEIIAIENEYGEVLFKGDNIKWININSAGTKAAVWYKDDGGKIINLENGSGNVLFSGDSVILMDLNSSGTKVIVQYKDGKKEIINLMII